MPGGIPRMPQGTFPLSQKKKPAEVSAGFPLVSFMAGGELALSPAFRHETVILFCFGGECCYFLLGMAWQQRPSASWAASMITSLTVGCG